MSYGTGWECDECGKREITPQYHSVGSFNRPPMDSVPIGWLTLLGPYKEVEEHAIYSSLIEHHFCSYKCVEDYAYKGRKHD